MNKKTSKAAKNSWMVILAVIAIGQLVLLPALSFAETQPIQTTPTTAQPQTTVPTQTTTTSTSTKTAAPANGATIASSGVPASALSATAVTTSTVKATVTLGIATAIIVSETTNGQTKTYARVTAPNGKVLDQFEVKGDIQVLDNGARRISTFDGRQVIFIPTDGQYSIEGPVPSPSLGVSLTKGERFRIVATKSSSGTTDYAKRLDQSVLLSDKTPGGILQVNTYTYSSNPNDGTKLVKTEITRASNDHAKGGINDVSRAILTIDHVNNTSTAEVSVGKRKPDGTYGQQLSTLNFAGALTFNYENGTNLLQWFYGSTKNGLMKVDFTIGNTITIGEK